MIYLRGQESDLIIELVRNVPEFTASREDGFFTAFIRFAQVKTTVVM